jgi:hypothetical protein
VGNIGHVIEIAGWIAFSIALVATAGLSVVAFFRNRPRLVWWAAGALALGLVLAAAFTSSPPYGASVLVTVLGATAAIFGGSAAAIVALDLAMGRSVQYGAHGGIIVASEKATASGALALRTEVLRGGATIGVLERVAAAGTIIAGFPEGLAIVVAVKGVGRFTELEASEARERFIIGTLASLVWACTCALAVHLAAR